MATNEEKPEEAEEEMALLTLEAITTENICNIIPDTGDKIDDEGDLDETGTTVKEEEESIKQKTPVHSALYNQYSTLSTVHSVQYTQYSTLSTVHPVQYTQYSTLSTVHSVQYPQYSTLCT